MGLEEVYAELWTICTQHRNPTAKISLVSGPRALLLTPGDILMASGGITHIPTPSSTKASVRPAIATKIFAWVLPQASFVAPAVTAGPIATLPSIAMAYRNGVHIPIGCHADPLWVKSTRSALAAVGWTTVFLSCGFICSLCPLEL